MTCNGSHPERAGGIKIGVGVIVARRADSRDPEHDLARALLARGIKDNVTLHDGPTRKPRTVVNIEKAAPWCVGSNLERYEWKAPEVSDNSPHTGEDGYLVLPTMPDGR